MWPFGDHQRLCCKIIAVAINERTSTLNSSVKSQEHKGNVFHGCHKCWAAWFQHITSVKPWHFSAAVPHITLLIVRQPSYTILYKRVPPCKDFTGISVQCCGISFSVSATTFWLQMWKDLAITSGLQERTLLPCHFGLFTDSDSWGSRNGSRKCLSLQQIYFWCVCLPVCVSVCVCVSLCVCQCVCQYRGTRDKWWRQSLVI